MLRVQSFRALIILILGANGAIAGQVILKPTDFAPLTSLPWKQPHATMRDVLEAIYREPDIKVREAVLVEYLKIIPVEKFDAAFDICIDLEGTPTPQEFLVSLFLEIWGKRDPRGCWKRTQSLFHVVGIEDWLEFNSWHDRPRITVPDVARLRSSRFSVKSYELLAFPPAVERSSLPKKERVQIMKKFADVWFGAFATWPGSGRGERTEPRDLLAAFAVSPEQLREQFRAQPQSVLDPDLDAVPFGIEMRRWMKMEPKSAIEIVKKARETMINSSQRDEHYPAGPSKALFTIWADADLPAMIRWTESLDSKKRRDRP